MSREITMFTLLLFSALAVLTPSCYGQTDSVTAPRFKLNLDLPEEHRWSEILSHWNVTDIRERAGDIIEEYVPKEAWPLVAELACRLDHYLPDPYAGEIRGVARAIGLSLGETVLINLLYDFIAACTAIVTQATDGTIWHARNLDFNIDIADTLRNMTAIIDFQRNGKTVYTLTSWVGHVGGITGQRANAFTVALNQRNEGSLAQNFMMGLVAAITRRVSWCSFVLRDALNKASTYDEALTRLVNDTEVAPIYYTIGGVKPGEGAVITRSRWKVLDVWTLDEASGRWYVLQTNTDRWDTPPADDNRRGNATAAMEATGQGNIGPKTLYKALSIPFVFSPRTIYTSIMSAANPRLYDTYIRYDANEL